MPKLRYIGAHDEVDIPSLGLVGVKRGHMFEAPDDAAGHVGRGKPGDKGYSEPDGLLGQHDNFEKADS